MFKHLFFLGFTILFLSACSNQKNYSTTGADNMSEVMSAPEGAGAEPKASVKITDRKIIKNGNIQFETNDIAATRKQVIKIVSDVKGYVSQDNTTNYDNKTEIRIQVRIPAASFDQVMNNVSENASLIESKNVNAQDVTEEFIDIEARIKTKKELENRYLSLLNKANSVTEILSIEKEIGALRAEIESIEGRLKYLNDNVAFSTLDIVFYEKTAGQFSFGSKFKSAIGDGWENILGFIIGLISLWPFILIIFIIYIVAKRMRKNARNRNSLKNS